ncbi:hypothetical protein [Enterococcus dispar]
MVDIKPGDVIFYRPTGFIGNVICKLTRSEYSHVSLAISPTKIIEANRFIKTRIADLHYTESVHSVYRLNNISPEDRVKIVNAAVLMEGAGYDYLHIIGLLLRVLFDIRTTVFNKVNRYICSEVIDRAFIEAGIPRKDQKDIGDLTPQELLDKYDLRRVV